MNIYGYWVTFAPRSAKGDTFNVFVKMSDYDQVVAAAVEKAEELSRQYKIMYGIQEIKGVA